MYESWITVFFKAYAFPTVHGPIAAQLWGPSRAPNVAHVGREARDQVRTERKGGDQVEQVDTSKMSKIGNLIAWISFRKMCWWKIQYK